MRLKIIGSGDQWTIHNSACYLIDDDILFDVPNGSCKALRKFKINPGNIHHVVISHFHGDHFFDIPFLLISKIRNKEVDETNIYCGVEGNKKIKDALKLAFPNTIEKIHKCTNVNYVNSKKFELGKYNVSRVLVDHGRLKPAYGYIFSDGEKKIGFTGDTCYCKMVEMMASECDYLICDVTLLKGNVSHMGIDNIESLASRYPKCKFFASHMDDRTRRELYNTKYKNIIICEDGHVYNL